MDSNRQPRTTPAEMILVQTVTLHKFQRQKAFVHYKITSHVFSRKKILAFLIKLLVHLILVLSGFSCRVALHIHTPIRQKIYYYAVYYLLLHHQ